MASAAARLMAVVVFPTPPFWLAMATITSAAILRSSDCALHLVFAQFVRIQAFEPLVQPVRIGLVLRHVERLGAVDDRVFDEDRRSSPQRQRNRVAWTRVDGMRLVIHGDV